jgi:hypothetical protein
MMMVVVVNHHHHHTLLCSGAGDDGEEVRKSWRVGGEGGSGRVILYFSNEMGGQQAGASVLCRE